MLVFIYVKTERKKRQADKTSKRTGRGGGKGKILVKLSLYICVCRKVVVPLHTQCVQMGNHGNKTTEEQKSKRDELY